MDFETGKLHKVAQRRHPSVCREYLLFWTLLTATSAPYAVVGCYFPFETACVMLCMAYFQVLATLAQSSGTATSHYMRFLLSGSNPVGMTGGSSLLFAAVDAMVDWREDSAARARNGPLFWAQTVWKFVLTPIGALLLLAEFAWDLLLLRHPRLWLLKWNELFSLAKYHDVICPEKSNDVFYADLAICRYQRDPYLYQWNRMRAMVFELKQYFDDAAAGLGVPASNLLLQSDVAAYQTLKRLQIERIEAGLQDHYAEHLDQFPFPKHLAQRLLKSARPIAHYEKMRRAIIQRAEHNGETQFSRQLRERYHENVDLWKVLRLLDATTPYTPAISRHVTQSDLNSMCAWDILKRHSDFEFTFTTRFLADWESWLESEYEILPRNQLDSIATQMVPDFFLYCKNLHVRQP